MSKDANYSKSLNRNRALNTSRGSDPIVIIEARSQIQSDVLEDIFEFNKPSTLEMSQTRMKTGNQILMSNANMRTNESNVKPFTHSLLTK